jgi:hypothetical protein
MTDGPEFAEKSTKPYFNRAAALPKAVWMTFCAEITA